jgi:SAM-dependent methyltransferase
MANDINSLLEKVKNLYTKGLEEYGFNSKSVGWKSKEQQYLRFFKLLSVVENKNDKFSIIDYGCGYTELLVYLIDNGYNVSKYIGYDISFFILKKAKIYLDQNNINSNIFDFILSNKINSFADFIVVSGTFNVKFDFDDNLYLKYILKKIRYDKPFF